jgi:hypothetical protein
MPHIQLPPPHPPTPLPQSPHYLSVAPTVHVMQRHVLQLRYRRQGERGRRDDGLKGVDEDASCKARPKQSSEEACAMCDASRVSVLDFTGSQGFVRHSLKGFLGLLLVKGMNGFRPNEWV